MVLADHMAMGITTIKAMEQQAKVMARIAALAMATLRDTVTLEETQHTHTTQTIRQESRTVHMRTIAIMAMDTPTAIRRTRRL